MFDADRTLVFAGAAGGALEDGRLGRSCLPSSGVSSLVAVFVQVVADAERDQLRVEIFAGVVGGAVFGAAAALDAGVGLQAVDLRDVFAGNECRNLRRRRAAEYG